MRVLLPIAATLMFSLGASAQSYSHEPNTYRHGGTYATTQANSEQSCAEICRADANCLVWSFLKPDTGIGASQCELKQSIGQTEENPLMTSGISPRFSGQSQAAPVAEPTTGLLGGQTTSQSLRYSPRPLRTRASAPAPETSTASSVAPSSPAVSTVYTAPPSRPSGRVLSPDDPRIIRNGGQTSVSVSSVPVPVSAPSQARPVQARAAVQRPSRPVLQERPYDKLRNRTFPNYSVQSDTELESDGVTEPAADTATEVAGS